MISLLRREIPDIVLRTTLITGFPGETQQEHEELMNFIDEIEFDRLGVFTYSPEEDTPAAVMPDQIDEEVKKARQAELMDAYVGRTYGDAPGVDGYIFVNTDTELISGDLCMVHITGALEYDLIGELKDEYTE